MEVEVRYKDESYDVTLIVGTATFADGLKRAALQGAYTVRIKEDEPFIKSLNGMEGLALYHVYPSCMAAPTKIENRGEKILSIPLGEGEMLNLPEPLVNMWAEAVWEANPHWSPFGKSNQTPPS